jgi:ABC-2 type transport system ATP-binding protein
VLRVDNVTKRYRDVVALADLDLRVEAGEIVALLGANGAGKSTLMSLVAGLRKPDAGTVAIGTDGGNPRTPAVRQQIGFAPQELGVYPRISVAANLRLFAEMAGLRGGAATQRIEETADDLGLTALLAKRAGDLSGGERRRVHVGMALVHRPPLVMLVEPSAGVDVAARASLLELVRRVAARGAAVLYSTHYLAEAEAFGARVAVLHRGRKVADATVSELVDGLPGRVELTFEGPAPEMTIAGVPLPQVDGSVVTFIAADPERNAATILSEGGPYLRRLRSVRVCPASLEDAYRALTGEMLLVEATT